MTNELMRLAAAGVAADSTYGEIVQRRFAGRLETEVAADLADLLREFGHEQVNFTVVGSGPNGANPHHEAGDRVPYMVEGEGQPLVPGMCFSVEPGIYLAGRFGVRIEDIVTVTADGGQRLNNTDHGLRFIQ
jgi:Xaa-Pro aminopeptidase